jgi:hypothetical protein
VSLERSWNVNIENGLALVIRNLQPKLWAKEGPGVKLAIWLPTTKSRESTSSLHGLVECDTALESSWRELQLWFKTRPNPSLGRGVMAIQSSGSPAGTISGVPTKWCSLDDQPQRILYGGRWWLPPSPGHGESCVSKCPWQVLTPKGVPNAKLTRFGWFLDVDSHELS